MIIKKFYITTVILFNFSQFVYAAQLHKEKEYQNKWCDANRGIQEYILPDGARVDCLTETHAIEFDFARKWAESIGQSLYYSYVTGKKPGIVLIMERPEKDQKFLKRLKCVTCKLGIDVWTMYESELLSEDINIDSFK